MKHQELDVWKHTNVFSHWSEAGVLDRLGSEEEKGHLPGMQMAILRCVLAQKRKHSLSLQEVYYTKDPLWTLIW